MNTERLQGIPQPVALVILREYGPTGMRTRSSQLFFSMELAEQECRKPCPSECGRQMFVFGAGSDEPTEVRSFDSTGNRTDACDEAARDSKGWNVEDAVIIAPKATHACSPVFVEHPAAIVVAQQDKAVVYAAEPVSNTVRFLAVPYCCLTRRVFDTSDVIDIALQAAVRAAYEKRSMVSGENFIAGHVMNGTLRADVAGMVIRQLRNNQTAIIRRCDEFGECDAA